MSFKGLIVNEDEQLIYNEKGEVKACVVDLEGNESQVFMDEKLICVLLGHDKKETSTEKVNTEGVDNDEEEETANCENNSNIANNIVYPSTSKDTRKCNVWTDGATKRLFDLYIEYAKDVGPFRRFPRKYNMYTTIAEQLSEEFNPSYTADQCDNRVKVVRAKQNAAIKNNQTSGNSRKEVPFQEEKERLKDVDDSVEPEVQLGVGVMHINKKPKLEKGSGLTRKPKTDKKDTNTLLERYLEA